MVGPRPQAKKGSLCSHNAAVHHRQFRPVTIWGPPLIKSWIRPCIFLIGAKCQTGKEKIHCHRFCHICCACSCVLTSEMIEVDKLKRRQQGQCFLLPPLTSITPRTCCHLEGGRKVWGCQTSF